MSRDRFLGGPMDAVIQSGNRQPKFSVKLWNPHRTKIADVVLGRAGSPAYDVTPWVVSINQIENTIWENSDDAVSSNCTMTILYDPVALPIPISEATMVDGAPVRILVGDSQVAEEDWIPVFTGAVRGPPAFTARTRKEGAAQEMTVMLVSREEAYLNTMVTARSYPLGTDFGKAVTETAIEFMGLDRREIKVGSQSYAMGFSQNQLVDVPVLQGLFLLLQTVGKKPRFDADGFLVASDTSLDKAPVRTFADPQALGGTQQLRASRKLVEHRAGQQGGSLYNSVRLTGLANVLTEVDQSLQRLAHGDMTSGWFESKVSQTINFSEPAGQAQGGRRAKDTYLKSHVGAFGAFLDATVSWTPFVESDGFTVFGGKIEFDTGFAPWVQGALVYIYLVLKFAEWVMQRAGNTALATGTLGGSQVAASYYFGATVFNNLATVELVATIIAMQSMGHVSWEIYGIPTQQVYRQLSSTAVLDGLRSEDIHELLIDDQFWFDIDFMNGRAKDMLRRELAKRNFQEIEMLDDPILETDDVIQTEAGERYYVARIQRTMDRSGAPNAIMTINAWKIRG